MNAAFICDAARTPIGRYGGALAGVRADDLAAVPLRALTERHSAVDWSCVDDVIYGCANQAGEDNRNVARMAALLAGLPASVGGVTVNRLCASGLDAVNIAARAIQCEQADLLLAGGVESMSRAPFVLGKAPRAFDRNAELHDTTMGWRFVNPAIVMQYGVDSMPETAENLAEAFDVSRDDQDRFALRSQQRTAAAQAKGFFRAELVPVTPPPTRTVRQPTVVEADEHPRANATLEALSALETPFRRGGTVTAGNSSGINDGACALLLASERAVSEQQLIPKARVVASACAGVEPRLMGYGPVPAMKKLLALVGMDIAQMDVIELNEAFAAQCLVGLRALGLPDDAPQVNPNGGAIAIGHPLGMSGARLVATAVNQLLATRGRYALCAMCVGVGQGFATLLERV